MNPEQCAKCKSKTRFIFQNDLCRKCLTPSLKRGTKTINEVRPLLSSKTETNSPEDAA
ncbi:hypothetical protein LEP1GSC034_1028 [Leptospira interrogans str. 2003000735]|nr:hypothetical protein LEP1GSC034_0764 [Leptospira interrogans str. 2003000735]EMJ72784.1 hypothetical protein LEP1GSC033_1512 [Leptospira interrogans str. 2002000632]EMJ76854.1 hypothetical protein LEP1GSC032_0575 [Leptospira interrogans str. 2002000631]EMJ69050.1 hypothetical protein LEP1GSC034_3449 [Leptospira interrogans str. 2003000735]EMJ70857.1 hypothetical protein LEP1GSC034_1028 [Leptospira interrogans str. 2003000735]